MFHIPIVSFATRYIYLVSRITTKDNEENIKAKNASFKRGQSADGQRALTSESSDRLLGEGLAWRGQSLPHASVHNFFLLFKLGAQNR